MVSTPQFKADFLARVANFTQIMELFDALPEIYFFAKDDQGRFTAMNRTLLDVLNLKTEADVIGKTDDDFFSPDMAERYRREDQEVMDGGKLIPNRVWIVPGHHGVIRWYVSSKIPLFDRSGKVIGIAGAMRDYEKAGAALAPYQRFSNAMRHVAENHNRKITTAQLARMTHLSVSQFNRQFKTLFGITPASYLTQVRINAAAQALTSTSDDLQTIARRCGFFDASHFVKQFRKVMGETPSFYRKRWAATS